ncbi:glycosyltransferase [Litoricolaceae bacterium]|nr:glycosyltransferase [Litorivicinaceae bacterium]
MITRYVSVRAKFCIAFVGSISWLFLSVYLSLPWLSDLSEVLGPYLAVYVIAFVAIIPGFMNAFIVLSLLLDARPIRKSIAEFPPVTVFVPAYNEEKSIRETVQSLLDQVYPGKLSIRVINDGSSDGTAAEVESMLSSSSDLALINLPMNAGKSEALNYALSKCETELVMTVDADCWVLKDGVRHLVQRLLSDPPNTQAVAGSILIRNSRVNWITQAQEWDYFLGIAAIKRIQSLFQGTLVAQGAFSIYRKQALEAVGGWPKTVGEDIVLSWRLLSQGYRIGHAEDACAFTICPTTVRQFVRQRQRWSRGLIEAFKDSPKLIFKRRFSTLFVVWNVLFPFMDLAYTLAFIPGILLAFFGIFWIVGPMTLALIPPSILLNQVMYRTIIHTFEHEHLSVRRNRFGFLIYILVYGIILQPANMYGYLSEVFRVRKTWGTK